MGGPDKARAVGGFNLTAQSIGFLQPLFAGNDGDNQTYIQRLDGLTRIAGFESVAWPERDTVAFESAVPATVSEESLWSFTFPNETPLILPWTKFRDVLRERIESNVFADHPLLQFDVVQTLNLSESKPAIYRRAFSAYARMDHEAANRWRDRAILEPELLDALKYDGIFTADSRQGLRVRLLDGVARIELADFSPLAADLLDRACREIAARYETIFPNIQRIEVLPKPPRPALPFRESKPITIILVGKLSDGELDTSVDYGREIDVINADHISNHLRQNRPSPLFLVLGRQSDWRHLIDIGNSIKHLHSLAVVFSTATEPLISDVDLQNALQIPSILMFALTRELTRKANPLTSIRPLIDIFSGIDRRSRKVFDVERMPAKHCLLLREEIPPDYETNEIGCKVGARAIRAGARPGARIDLFVDGTIEETKGNEWEQVFEPLFATSYPSETTIPRRTRKSYLTLLADRLIGERSYGPALQEGATRLLTMRGWRVERNEHGFMISDDNRQFPAVFVERKEDTPAEDLILRRPSFGRSHLLVIHASTRREPLLIGNRGQFCHITLEDISLMRPGTQWIWPVLRRQLDAHSARTSLAALRLVASLATEAIQLGRIGHSSIEQGALDQLVSILQADDCERFVDFAPSRSGGDQSFHLRMNLPDKIENFPLDQQIRLNLKDDGPIVFFD
jgi:hypothetical protein